MIMGYQVNDNKELNRFEVHEEGEIGFLEYEADENYIALLHTEVPGDIGGKGIAQALAGHAFNFAKEKKLKVLVYCPFVSTYVKRHPELNELIGKK